MKPESMPLLSLFERYKQTTAHHKDAACSVRRAGSALETLATFGVTSPAEVTYPVLLKVVEFWKGLPQPLSGGTINRYLSALSGLLQEGVRFGMIPSLPPIPWQVENGGRKDHLSREHWETLYIALNRQRSYFGHLAWLLLHSGMRLSEAVGLAEGDLKYSLCGQYLIAHLKDTKNGSERLVPIPAHGVSMLLRGRPGDLLFCDHGGQASFKRQFQTAFKTEVNRLWPGRVLVPHSLRHTCASWMAEADVPLNVIAEYLGHRSLTTTRRYAHQATKGLIGALRKIEVPRQ